MKGKSALKLVILGIAFAGFVVLVLPPLRNASVAKAVRRNLDARGYADVTAALNDRHVYLLGRSKSADERAAVAKIARATPGVEKVSNFTGIEDDLADARRTAANLGEELRDALARLDDTNAQLAALRARAAQTRAVLAKTRQTLATRTEEFELLRSAWGREKARLEVALGAAQGANARLENQLHATATLLAESRRVIARRDQQHLRESDRLHRSIADLGGKLQSAESQLASARHDSAALDAKNDATATLLAEVRRVVAARDREFAAQSEMLLAAETALAALRTQLETQPPETADPQPNAFRRFVRPVY